MLSREDNALSTRNEETGLRCVYHGWKFDADGTCFDMPNEPACSDFKHKVRATAYACHERGGILWAYMGAPELQPELQPALPDLEWADIPYGFVIGARRLAEADSDYWRFTQWLFPFFQMIPPFADGPISGHAGIPIDDEHCWTFSMTWHPRRPLTDAEVKFIEDGSSVHALKIPGTIIQMRRRLMRAATELRRGIEPPALDPTVFRVRCVSMLLPRGVTSWPEAAREAMTAEPDRSSVSVA